MHGIRLSRPERKAVRRQQLLDAAREVFSSKGYTATRIEDITQASGLAKGTFYLYFEEKCDAFAALADDLLTAVENALEDSRALHAKPEPNPAKACKILEDEIAAVLAIYHENRAIATILLHEARLQEAALESRLTAYYARVVRHFSAGLETMRKAGVARSLDAKVAAQCIVGTMERAVQTCLPRRAGSSEIRRLAREIAQLECRGVFR